MLKVYYGKLYKDKRYLEILNPNLGFRERNNVFGDKDIFDDFNKSVLEIVDNPELCDFIIIPHNYYYIDKVDDYIKEFVDLSNKFNKKIIIFSTNDSTSYINIPNSIIFRMSQYLSRKKDNEIIMPAYSTDLSYGNEIMYREKRKIPIIGFCGWASVNGLFNKIIFWFKNTFILKGTHRLGLYFRIKMIKLLNKSKLVKNNFIIRSSYSANKNTISIDPIKARHEYIENIKDSDFVLAPKGDGNFSVRFYEILSLGRIPILIDTDCPLPLDKDIDYSKFIIKVSYKDIKNIDKIISDFYDKISNEEWINMQRRAREAFEKYLRIDSFFRFIFTKDNIIKYTSK